MRKLLGDDRTSLVMLALMFGLAAANWPFLPDRLPIHWSSADAPPDSYAPRAFALLFLPVYAVIQYWILRMVSRRVAPGGGLDRCADRVFLRPVARRSGSRVMSPDDPDAFVALLSGRTRAFSC